MKKILSVLLTFLLFSSSLNIAQAQSDGEGINFEIGYDEVRSRLFSGLTNSQFSERWRLLDAQVGDIPIIQVTRISGQFSPTIRLYDSLGTLLAESSNNEFSDTSELIYDLGLPADIAPFQIEIIAENVISDFDNPAEYSLSVEKDGARRSNPDEGISTLPDVGSTEPPQLQIGDAQTVNGIDSPIYGEIAEVSNSATAQIPTRISLNTDSWQLDIDQAIPLSRGVSAISFLDTGIGLTIRNENLAPNANRRFFSDENFLVSYNDVTRDYIFTLASGMVITSTFTQIDSIEVRDGVAGFRIINGDRLNRIVSDSQNINIRRGGGELANFVLTFDNNSITTDLAVWDTLAHYENQVRVYYGTESRFLSDVVNLNLIRNPLNNRQNIVLNLQEKQITLNLDWTRFSDVSVSAESVTTQARNGITASEPFIDLARVFTDNGAVQFLREDESFRTVYPDGTDIFTPSQLSNNSDILPYETGFRTRNYNNLGANILPACPCSEDIQAHTPINPTNGNFFYTVSDFTTQGQALTLNLDRYYNSHDSRYAQGIAVDSRLTPRYLANNPNDYVRFGNGWRHSYQHELDITSAPKGRITYIEPDGTGHYFFPSEAGNQWTSRTLLSMIIFQDGGILGSWRAEQSDGIKYYFDRVGRLTRIMQANQSIILTPMSADYSEQAGLFIVDPYGRRLELYTGDSGRIESALNTELSRINYQYNGTNLVGVEYAPSTPAINANYTYNTVGLLTRYDDVRSPYTQVGSIEYDAQNRVLNFQENPDGDLSRLYIYFYTDDEEVRNTNRVFEVNGTRRIQTWTYNDIWQLTSLALPSENWVYEFRYSENTGLLNSVRVPTGVSFQLDYDARGNLIRFEDPVFTAESAYNLSYELRGTRSLLTEIRYPNNHTDRFIWSEGDNPLLLAKETLAFIGVERDTRTTRYEYNESGQLIMQVSPDNIATIYEYDSVGYVSALWRGIILEDGEVRADIERIRAESVLEFDYDLSGQIQQIRDGRGSLYNIGWNNNGQIAFVSAPNNTRLDYNYNDRGLITSINDRGQETIYVYNGLDLVTDVVDAVGAQQSFFYDEAGNLLSEVNGLGLSTSYTYDILDNLTEYRSPTGFVTRYTTTLNIDNNSIIRTETDPAGTVYTRRYNFLGRLNLYRISNPAENYLQEFNLSYTSGGNLSLIEDTQLGTRYLGLSYNLIGEVLSVDVSGSETQFGYNSEGLLTEVISPAGRVTQYTYDSLGNINSITLPDSTRWLYDYDENSNLRTVTNPLGITSTYIPNELNQLEVELDALGNTQSYSYDLRGNLISFTDPDEITTTYTYNAVDRLGSITDPRNNQTIYTYDRIGRLLEVNQPQVRLIRFTYDDEDNIIAVSEGERTLYSYDSLGRITSITDPLGHTTAYDYNPLGLVTNIRDALGNNETFTWGQSSNFLNTYTSSSGNRYVIDSDILGRVNAIRLVNDNSEDPVAEPIDTQIFYDDDGYITTIQVGTLTARTSGDNDQLFVFEYAENGYPSSYTDALGGEWQLEYDAIGQLISVTNPRGIITQYSYDALGNIITVVNYLGDDSEFTENFTYDRRGNITAYEIPDVVRHEYIYNVNNSLVQANLAVGTESEARYLFDYNANNDLSCSIDPVGRRNSYLYPFNAPQTLASYAVSGVQDCNDLSADAFIIGYDYDGAGNLQSVTLPGTDNINITYDALNRRVRYVDGTDNSWAYTYDDAGNISQISDPLGSVVEYTYDTYNRVTEIQYPSGSIVNLAYDTAGNLATVTLSSNVNGTRQGINYQLDEKGQVTSMQVGANFIGFEYDAVGNITRRISSDNSVTSYEYDSAGRLINTRYSDDSQHNYSYDTLGNLLSVDNIQFAYDSLGRLTRSEDNSITNYRYDLVGNLLERNNEQLGITSYGYDDLHRTSVINFEGQEITVSYDERGRISDMLRGETLATAIDYDENDRIIGIRHTNPQAGTRLELFTYTYDAVGNLVTVLRREGNDVPTEISYSYDVDQRLISERWLNSNGETFYVVSYRYDNVGNRIEENRNGHITTFNYNGQNQLISERRNVSTDGTEFFFLPSITLGLIGLIFVRRRRKLWIMLPIFTGLLVSISFAQSIAQITVEYDYDRNSNLSQIRYIGEDIYSLNMAYDQENRLISVSGQSIAFDDEQEIGININTTYSYDAFSRVVGISTNDAEYTLYYDKHTLIGMSDGENLERYLNFNGERLLTLTADGEILWNLNDRLGSTRRYANTDSSLIDDPALELEFSSFGIRIFPFSQDRIAPNGARISDPTQFFAGQLYDPSTRLYLMGVRAYDPTIGRFLQPDPIRQDPIGTLYTYARNRPLVFNDPTGMVVEPFTAPLDANILDTQINPENLIPQISDHPIPTLASVHRLQEDEAVRALELLEATRFGVNETVLQLSPLDNNLYLFALNPLPDTMQSLLDESLEQVLEIYDSGEGWQIDPLPNPRIADNPFEIINEVQALLAPVYIQPATINSTGHYALDILPTVSLPQAISEQLRQEQSIADLLQPIQAIGAFETESDTLLNILTRPIAPSIALPDVRTPNALIEPPILHDLDDLREQTFDFYSRIWSFGAYRCEDCLAPLGFSQ
ncbi:MAG: hypothetical protein Phog2KO_18320 [Phototrophicaceae bacterium]